MKTIIHKLLSEGQLSSAINLYKSLDITDESILSLFTIKMFNYKERELLPRFLLQRINVLRPQSLPIVLGNILNISEMSGDISSMKQALKKLIDLGGNDLFLKESVKNTLVIENYFNVLCKCFLYKEADKYITNLPDALKITYKIKLEKINSFFKENNLDVFDLENYKSCFIQGKGIKVPNNTIIFKLPPSFSFNILEENDNFYPINILRDLTEYNVFVSPQYSMPGPAFSYPYISGFNESLIIVDHHKYSESRTCPSKKRKNCYIHLKMMHKRGYFLVNDQGYSGWFRDIYTKKESPQVIDDYFKKHRKKWLKDKKIKR